MRGCSKPKRARAFARSGQGGWTLIELVIVITIMTILTMGVIPMARTAIRRQKEHQLREALREMRYAIREFHRDTVAAPCCTTPGAPGGAGAPQQPPPQAGQPPNPQGQQVYFDPRSKVAISDRTIFDTRNLDHYPPTLDVLVEGVSVVPRVALMTGGAPDINRPPTQGGGGLVSLQKKTYLRRIPVDPFTGKAEWGMRSCYQEADVKSWDGVNVFDVYSLYEGTALNGEEKYSDW